MSAEAIANSILAGRFTDQLAAVEAVLMYFYNVDPVAQIKGLFDNPAPSYIAQWSHLYRQGLTEWWGHLDVEHKRAYVSAALDRYGAEAYKRIGVA
jgi:hypothetical protein